MSKRQQALKIKDLHKKSKAAQSVYQKAAQVSPEAREALQHVDNFIKKTSQQALVKNHGREVVDNLQEIEKIKCPHTKSKELNALFDKNPGLAENILAENIAQETEAAAQTFKNATNLKNSALLAVKNKCTPTQFQEFEHILETNLSNHTEIAAWVDEHGLRETLLLTEELPENAFEVLLDIAENNRLSTSLKLHPELAQELSKAGIKSEKIVDFADKLTIKCPTRKEAEIVKLLSENEKLTETLIKTGNLKKEAVWLLEAKKRGVIIENLSGHNLNPHNFPTIDCFDKATGKATSIKSINLNAPAYQNCNKLRARLEKYVNQLAEFKGRDWGDTFIKEHEILSRDLKVIIPHGGSLAQRQVLQEIIEEALKKKIKVIVDIF